MHAMLSTRALLGTAAVTSQQHLRLLAGALKQGLLAISGKGAMCMHWSKRDEGTVLHVQLADVPEVPGRAV
jgi:hypothetical protein